MSSSEIKIYNYVCEKYGEVLLKKTPIILKRGNYSKIKEITEFLESTIGLDIVKNNGGTILILATKKSLEEILNIPEFEYDEKTKTYNKELLSASTFLKRPSEIRKIFDLPYWQDDEYKHLLTSSIWLKDARQIKEILELKYWQDEKYDSLLISSIWLKNADKIVDNIKFCRENGLEHFDNNPTLILRLTKNELQVKVNYLNYHEIPLFNNGRINSIFSMTNINMIKKYGISKNKLIRDYLNLNIKSVVLC